MEWHDWRPTEDAIRTALGYGRDEDLAAANVLLATCPGLAPIGHALARLRGREATVVACGPGLAQVEAGGLAGSRIVAADGATRRLMELQVAPHVVVSDLDGDPEGLLWAAAQGAVTVVHAHGDNIAALQDLAPRLTGTLCGTHHGPPDARLAPLVNLGGFTDGDRAVLLAEAAGARAVRLLAWQPEAGPGAYSHRFDPARKQAKLAWAQQIVADAAARGFPVSRPAPRPRTV